MRYESILIMANVSLRITAVFSASRLLVRRIIIAIYDRDFHLSWN